MTLYTNKCGYLNCDIMFCNMKSKLEEKQQVIKLRKLGYTYNEILAEVPVARSSVSLWCKDLPLNKEEQEILRQRKDSNISKGRVRAAVSNKRNRLVREEQYLSEAKIVFQTHQNNQLFHTGIALYWAEGAKRNDQWHFMNSDFEMIEVMLKWLEEFTEYKRSDIGFRLYVHDPYKHENWEVWWQKKLRVRQSQFKKTIIKPTQLGVKKRPNYKGCLRVEVPRSSRLLIQMKFWTNMLVEYHKDQ